MIQFLFDNLSVRLADDARPNDNNRKKGWLKNCCHLGSEHLSNHDAPSRMVFVPDSETYSLPSAPVKRDLTVKKSKTRTSIINVHLWGKDYDDTEAMLEALTLALDEETNSKYEFLTGRWLEEGDQGAVSLGRVLIQPFSLQTALYSRIRSFVTPVNIKIIGHIDTVPPLDPKFP